MEPSAELDASGNGLSPLAIRALAGLEVGVIAGLPAIAWLLFHSWLRGEPWWAKLNVAGAPFFGPSVYSMGFSRASLAGCALLILGYGLLGVVFGLLARPHGVARNLVLGLLFAIAWQLACQQYLLRLLDTFALAYYPPLSTLPAQLMFGIALARFGPRFQALAADWGDPSWAHVPEPPIDPPIAPSDEPSVETPDEPPDEPLIDAGVQSHFVGPMREVSSPESSQIGLSDGSESKESKRTQETDC